MVLNSSTGVSTYPRKRACPVYPFTRWQGVGYSGIIELTGEAVSAGQTSPGRRDRDRLMDPLWDENRPESCLKVGLDCRTCVQRSASSVASVCPGLGSAGAEQVFLQIFPSEGCAPMLAAFAAAYAEMDAGRRASPLSIVVAA